jgi:hypothetical protein
MRVEEATMAAAAHRIPCKLQSAVTAIVERERH